MRSRLSLRERIYEGSLLLKDQWRIVIGSLVYWLYSRILINLVFGEFFLYISCVEMNNYLLREINVIRYRIFWDYEILTFQRILEFLEEINYKWTIHLENIQLHMEKANSNIVIVNHISRILGYIGSLIWRKFRSIDLLNFSRILLTMIKYWEAYYILRKHCSLIKTEHLVTRNAFFRNSYEKQIFIKLNIRL